MTKNILKFFTPIFTFLVLHSTTLAATASSVRTVKSFTGSCSMTGLSTLKDIIMNFVIGCILTRTFFLLVAVSFVIFLWGVFKLITSEGNEQKQGSRDLMFWGVVGLFVMVSLLGIVYILQSTFNIGGSYNITPKQVNISF